MIVVSAVKPFSLFHRVLCSAQNSAPPREVTAAHRQVKYRRPASDATISSREMSGEGHGEPHASSGASSTERPRGAIGQRRPPNESPGTLRGAPSGSSLTRPRLADLSNLRRCSFTGADSPSSLSIFRNMIEGRSSDQSDVPPASPAIGVGCNPVAAAPPSDLLAETPQTMMNALRNTLSKHSDSAHLYRATPLLLTAAASRSAPAFIAPPAAPLIQPPHVPLPPQLRTCCVCLTVKDPTRFKRITISWRKTAFVLLGRQFPGCFGTTSASRDICASRRDPTAKFVARASLMLTNVPSLFLAQVKLAIERCR